jgi:membrane-bound lytic murein transglycosylase
MPFVALAVLGAGYYSAQQNRMAMDRARDEASRASAIAAEQMSKQAAAQQAQADVARETLSKSIASNAENKAKLEKEVADQTASMEAERKALGEKESERIKRMQRSGSRSLLSQTRLAPELGLGNGDMTLGAGIAI